MINKINKSSSNIEFENGLSIISNKDLSKTFIFQEKEKKAEITIIEIGKKATNIERHIFQLTNNTISGKCINEDIKVITFFIGTQKEFENWESIHLDELATFEQLGIDWCNFYKRQSH